jgi:hypothetical protein
MYVKSSLVRPPRPRLRLTSPVLAAAGQERWDPSRWRETCDSARASRLLGKIKKLAAASPSANDSAPFTVREAEERLSALLARTEARENASLIQGQENAIAASEARRRESLRAARAWVNRLCVPINVR